VGREIGSGLNLPNSCTKPRQQKQPLGVRQPCWRFVGRKPCFRPTACEAWLRMEKAGARLPHSKERRQQSSPQARKNPGQYWAGPAVRILSTFALTGRGRRSPLLSEERAIGFLMQMWVTEDYRKNTPRSGFLLVSGFTAPSPSAGAACPTPSPQTRRAGFARQRAKRPIHILL